MWAAIKPLLSFIGAAGWWVVDKIHGDAIFKWLRPMIPEVITNPTLDHAITWAPPVALILLGFWLFLKALGKRADRNDATLRLSYDQKERFASDLRRHFNGNDTIGVIAATNPECDILAADLVSVLNMAGANASRTSLIIGDAGDFGSGVTIEYADSGECRAAAMHVCEILRSVGIRCRTQSTATGRSTMIYVNPA